MANQLQIRFGGKEAKQVNRNSITTKMANDFKYNDAERFKFAVRSDSMWAMWVEATYCGSAD